MNELTRIGNQEIEVKEFKGQRVVTLKEIDLVHGRADGTARRNFNQNKDKLIVGEDYFFVKPKDVEMYEIRTSEINNSGTYLITQQGYLMLVKSFTDDLSWQVQRQLVNNYFNGGITLETVVSLFKDFKAEIRLEIEELAEQGKENHRPSHKTKLDFNHAIKSYAVCKGDEEVLKQMTLEHFNATKWEDIPYDRKVEVLRYIRHTAEKLDMFVQIRLDDEIK